jgi:hypothetical protein
LGATSALADTPNRSSCWIRAIKAGMFAGAAAVMAATCSHLARPLIRNGIASCSVRGVGEIVETYTARTPFPIRLAVELSLELVDSSLQKTMV